MEVSRVFKECVQCVSWKIQFNLLGFAHARTNRKDDNFMQRRLYIDEAHTALDIFRIAAFLMFILTKLKCWKLLDFSHLSVD